MVDQTYSILNGLGQEGLVRLVAAMLAALFVLGLISEKFRRIAPALMTSLGILGTFCGIFVALHPLDFSADAINDSVKKLLNGMTIAFVTSLYGIFAAVLFRIVSVPLSFFLRRVTGAKPPVPEEQREILKKLEEIKQAIAGEGDSSIATQIIKLRDDNREGFKKLDGLSETIRGALVENLQTLTTEIRDIIGKQLGESLQKLIREIEDALIRKFGETFVQFNDATQALKKWQEDHRSQVEQLTAAFDQTAKGMASIVEGCEKIPQTMLQLQEVVGTAHLTVESLNRQVEAFAGMRQQAEESFPVIKQHLDKIGDDLAASAKSFEGLENTIQATFSNMEQESKAVAEKTAQSMRGMAESMNAAFQYAEQETRKIAQQHSENVTHIIANMRQTMENAQSESASKVTGIVEKVTEQFSQAMEAEVFRVAQAWGENLVSIATTAREAIDATKRGQR